MTIKTINNWSIKHLSVQEYLAVGLEWNMVQVDHFVPLISISMHNASLGIGFSLSNLYVNTCKKNSNIDRIHIDVSISEYI